MSSPDGDHACHLSPRDDLLRQLRDALELERRTRHEHAAACRLVECLRLELIDLDCEPDARDPVRDM